MLQTHSKLAQLMGMHPNDVLISDIGKVMEFTPNSAKITGTVTAGQPIFAYENYEDYYTFPADEFRGEDLFMLRVEGTSMIDAGIMNGDKIIVRRQETAENGEIVVALVEDSATVKRFYRRDGHIVLHPENEALSDMIFEDGQVSILGKVVGLMRNYRS